MSVSSKNDLESDNKNLHPNSNTLENPESSESKLNSVKSSYARIRENLIFPLLLIITGLTGYSTYKTATAIPVIESPPPASSSFVAPRSSGEKQEIPSEEPSESAVELFYKELATHGTVETEINNLLDAKISVLGNHINQRCKDEMKLLLNKYLSEVQADAAKIKSAQSPDLLDRTIDKIDSLKKRANSNCP